MGWRRGAAEGGQRYVAEESAEGQEIGEAERLVVHVILLFFSLPVCVHVFVCQGRYSTFDIRHIYALELGTNMGISTQCLKVTRIRTRRIS